MGIKWALPDSVLRKCRRVLGQTLRFGEQLVI